MDIIVNPQLVIHNLADAFLQKANGQLTSETMSALSTDELTLLAYVDFRREMLEGGMIQLIHNGYGPFIFENPFALVLKQWGLRDVAKIVYEGKKVYRESREKIESVATDDDFIALYEQFPKLDKLDDAFVELEPEATRMIAEYFINLGYFEREEVYAEN